MEKYSQPEGICFLKKKLRYVSVRVEQSALSEWAPLCAYTICVSMCSVFVHAHVLRISTSNIM